MKFMSKLKLAVKKRTDEIVVVAGSDTYEYFLRIISENITKKITIDRLKTIFKTNSEELISQKIGLLSEKEHKSLRHKKLKRYMNSLTQKQIEKFLDAHFDSIFTETMKEHFDFSIAIAYQ